MSVAFRRESDEEHKEPRFELPIPLGPNLVTAHGLQRIVETIGAKEAKLAGCMDEQQRKDLKRDLRYWNTRQAMAVVAPLPSTEEVAFGSRVEIRVDGKLRTIDIVGSDEADPSSGRLAFTAPLARALIGGVVGEQSVFGTNAQAIEIIAIEVIPDDVSGKTAVSI